MELNLLRKIFAYTMLQYEGAKLLMIIKEVIAPYLTKSDVETIVNLNSALILQYFFIRMDFCKYYYNILEILRNFVSTHYTVVSLRKIFHVFDAFYRASKKGESLR